MLQLTGPQFDERIRYWTERMQGTGPVSADDYLEFGRLWNTLYADASLAAEPANVRFIELAQAQLPGMTAALNMVVGRGFAWASQDHDFVLGGVLDERHRYRIHPRRTQ